MLEGPSSTEGVSLSNVFGSVDVVVDNDVVVSATGGIEDDAIGGVGHLAACLNIAVLDHAVGGANHAIVENTDGVGVGG